MAYINLKSPGRARNYLTKGDRQDIKERIGRGENPASIAEYYNISEFAARKIAGILLE